MTPEYQPSADELVRRDAVIAEILACTRENRTIRLPDFDPAQSVRGEFALHTVGIEANSFGGTFGDYRYQFEGEEDLLHLIVSKVDLGHTSVDAAHRVCKFLLPDVPVAYIWFKPGEYTQHFYLGHDVLLEGFGTSQQ